MIWHETLRLPPMKRGGHIITPHIIPILKYQTGSGLLHLFIQHTSAALCIQESADPDVIHDMELMLNRLVPEHQPGVLHDAEGPDDMPSHVKAALLGSSLTIPIQDGKLLLGTWQGIWLYEFRNQARSRTLIVTQQYA